MRSFVLLTLVAALVSVRARAEHPIDVKCRGLEQYEIRGTQNVDWVYGNIRARDRQVTIGFAIGSMVEEVVPAERPPGFRTFKTERIGNVLLRYGLNVRDKQMQATLIGAPMCSRVNLISHPKHAEELLVLARALAVSPCEVTVHRH